MIIIGTIGINQIEPFVIGSNSDIEYPVTFSDRVFEMLPESKKKKWCESHCDEFSFELADDTFSINITSELTNETDIIEYRLRFGIS